MDCPHCGAALPPVTDRRSHSPSRIKPWPPGVPYFFDGSSVSPREVITVSRENAPVMDCASSATPSSSSSSSYAPKTPKSS